MEEQTLIAQKAAKHYEHYIKNFKDVTMEMCSLTKNQQHFLMDLLPSHQPISRATQMQHEEGDPKLALRLATTEYHTADPKPKIGTLSKK